MIHQAPKYSLFLPLALSLLLATFPAAAQDRWDAVLDRYEAITAQCTKLRSEILSGKAVPDKKVAALLGELSSLRATLGEASGSMSDSQRARFKAIRDSYSGKSEPVATAGAASSKNPSSGGPSPRRDASLGRHGGVGAKTAVADERAEASLPAREPLEPLARPFLPFSPTAYSTHEYSSGLSRKSPLPTGGALMPQGRSESLWRIDVLAVAGFDERASFGVFAALNKGKVGAYLQARSVGAGAAWSYSCFSDGSVDGGGRFWGDGGSRFISRSLSGGLVWTPLSPVPGVSFGPFLGGGFGRSVLLWSDTSGHLAKVADYSREGLLLEAGALVRIKRATLLGGCSSLGGVVYPLFGLGFNF